MQTYAVVNTGLTLLALGQLDEAENTFNDALALSKRWENPDAALGPLCEIHHGLATIRLLQNRQDEAWEQAYTAYTIAQRSDDQRHHGW